MNDPKTKARKYLEETLPDAYFIVDISYKDKGPKAKLTLLIDGDEGISIDTCANISRQVGEQIEAKNWIEGPYVLEVSSPGIDTPLQLKRQYPKNIGRELRVKLKEGREIRGTLREVREDSIIIEVDNKIKKGNNKEKPKEIMDLAFSDIQEAKVLISFK